MTADEQPDKEMMAAAIRLARFIASGAASPPDGLFAEKNVAIVENFPPHLFTGPVAVSMWAKQMRLHLEGVSELRYSFGEPCDFSRSGDLVYLSLPTFWRGYCDGKPFSERGGWAMVLVLERGQWRVQAYGWAVTESNCG